MDEAHLSTLFAAIEQRDGEADGVVCGLWSRLIQSAPEVRASDLVSSGRIVAWPDVGGLHHRYERQAA